jgi:AraC-like DNA-binding protein
LFANVYFIIVYSFLSNHYASNAKVMIIAANLFLIISILKNSLLLHHLDQKSKKQEEKIAAVLTDVGNWEPEEDHGDKYRKSGLTETQAETLKQQILQMMATEKPFLDSELSLSDLAKRLKTSNHNLTEVLNRHINKGFFQFINEYRIEEAIQKMGDPKYENFTLLAHACGFNSKTTFIKYFKQQVGKTPSQYAEEMDMIQSLEAT